MRADSNQRRRTSADAAERARDAVVQITLPSDVRGAVPEIQLGYMVAPHLVATCWHPSLLSLTLLAAPTAKASTHEVLVKREKYRVLRAWANSQADCAVLQLDRRVPDVIWLRLGTVWAANARRVMYWERSPNVAHLFEQTSQLDFSQPQVHEVSGLPILTLQSDLTGTLPEHRGSPIISATSGICFGHALGNPIGGRRFAVCPAFWISQLMPFCIPYQNLVSSRKVAVWRRRLLTGLGEMLHVTVFTTHEADHAELALSAEFHASPTLGLPGIQIHKGDVGAPLYSVPSGHILLLVLEKSLEQTEVFKKLCALAAKREQPPMLWASVIADRNGGASFWRLQQSGFQVSVERPLRWIFDRTMRLNAWARVLEQLRLQVMHSRPAFQSAAKAAPFLEKDRQRTYD